MCNTHLSLEYKLVEPEMGRNSKYQLKGNGLLYSGV